MNQTTSKSKPLAIVLTVVFVVAVLMGLGPGLWIVSPDPASTGAPARWLGMPVVYAWALLWFAVMAGVVVVASWKLWSGDDGE